MTIIEAPLDEAPPPPPARRGLPALLLGIIAWPRSTFTYLRDHGGRSWLVPLGLALALTLVSRLIAQPIERAQAEALQAQIQAQIDAQQNGQGGDTGDGGSVFFSGPIGGPVGSAATIGGPAASNPVAEYGLPLLGVLGDWVLRGGALLLLAWVLGGRPTVGSMFRMSGWTFVPDIARLVVMVGVMLALGRVPVRGLSGFTPGGNGVAQVNITAGDGSGVVTSDGTTSSTDGSTDGDPQDNVVTFGPGGVSNGAPGGAPPFLFFLQSAFLSSLDVYLLWGLLLLAIGVAVTARLGWIKAGLATLVYFGLSIVLATLPTLLSLYLMQLAGPGSFVR